MEGLDRYIEDLYSEELAVKTAATAQIGGLFRRVQHLPVLLQHPSLLSVLARSLREDGRWSLDLSVHILSTFFALSQFSQFHDKLLELRAGAAAMDTLELALRRVDHREGASRPGTAAATRPATGTRPPTRTAADQRSSITAAWSPLSSRDLLPQSPAPYTGADDGRLESLIWLALGTLTNLAEAAEVAPKMLARGIMPLLARLLPWPSAHVEQLAITLLLQLSVLDQAPADIIDMGILPRLVLSVSCADQQTAELAMRLLHNLSFLEKGRKAMVSAGAIPKVAQALQRHLGGWAVLYHLSMEDAHKPLFMAQLPLVYQHFIHTEDFRSAPELLALAVNLTHDRRIAEELGRSRERVERLMGKAKGDPLAFKIMRNLSQHGGPAVQVLFIPFIPDIVTTVMDPASEPDLVVEAMGTLANLSLPQYDWQSTMAVSPLHTWLASKLVVGQADDDIIFEAILLTATVCNEHSAASIADAGLGQLLIALLVDRKDDDEFVLQIIVTLHTLLDYPSTRDACLGTSEGLYYILDLLEDPNPAVEHAARVAVNVILASGGHWAEQVTTLHTQADGSGWQDVLGPQQA